MANYIPLKADFEYTRYASIIRNNELRLNYLDTICKVNRSLRRIVSSIIRNHIAYGNCDTLACHIMSTLLENLNDSLGLSHDYSVNNVKAHKISFKGADASIKNRMCQLICSGAYVDNVYMLFGLDGKNPKWTKDYAAKAILCVVEDYIHAHGNTILPDYMVQAVNRIDEVPELPPADADMIALSSFVRFNPASLGEQLLAAIAAGCYDIAFAVLIILRVVIMDGKYLYDENIFKSSFHMIAENDDIYKSKLTPESIADLVESLQYTQEFVDEKIGLLQ